MAVFQMMQLIPENITHLTIDSDSALHQVLRSLIVRYAFK